MHGESSEKNTLKTCSQIRSEIDSLKNEKVLNTSSKITSIVFGGGYPYGLSNEEIDIKIRILKLELLNCD